MRYAKPSLAAASEFDPGSMESSAGICPGLQQNAATAVSTAAKSLNSLFSTKYYMVAAMNYFR